MKRKKPREPRWNVDEDDELIRDAELAELYGFFRDSITAARNDLQTYSWTFHNNPFDVYEASSRSIESTIKRLVKECDSLEIINKVVNSSLVHEVVEDLRDASVRLKNIQGRLPRRPHSLQTISVIYLMAVWYHTQRAQNYSGPTDVVDSFNGDEPIHLSMKFVIAMLGRSQDAHLRNISKSTIRRAVRIFRSSKPHPSEVYSFKGDATLFY